jgi:hypothetical protein
MSACKLVAKAAKWIAENIAKIPLLISKVIDGITDLPSNIKNKIKGNIKLYITANDLVNLYSVPYGGKADSNDDISLLARIDRLINELTELSKGNMWTTHFTGNTDVKGFILDFGKAFINKDSKYRTDIDIMKSITKQQKYLQKITFSQTVIDMNDPANIDIYFSKNHKMKYKDFRGNHYENTYLEAMRELLGYINDRKDLIKDINDAIGSKFVESQDNGTFAQLGSAAQKTITSFFQTTSKLVEIVGNLTRYILVDVKTIEKNSNQIKAAATKFANTNTSDEEKEEYRADAEKYYKRHPIKKGKDKVSSKIDSKKKKVVDDAVNNTEDNDRHEKDNRNDRIFYSQHKDAIDNLKNHGFDIIERDGDDLIVKDKDGKRYKTNIFKYEKTNGIR